MTMKNLFTLHYGFSSANREGEPAWFHTPKAAERFNAACGGIFGEVETTREAMPQDILDTPDKPWTKE